MQTTSIISLSCAFALSLAIFSCDSPREEAREDALERKADAIEEEADRVRENTEGRADQLEERADEVRDNK